MEKNLLQKSVTVFVSFKEVEYNNAFQLSTPLLRKKRPLREKEGSSSLPIVVFPSPKKWKVLFRKKRDHRNCNGRAWEKSSMLCLPVAMVTHSCLLRLPIKLSRSGCPEKIFFDLVEKRLSVFLPIKKMEEEEKDFLRKVM
ncbi:hypothetical protein CEXT_605621 [Caerostris extrusa]|uniref:Ribosomal protein S10 n=1 Tax=Caerostris extrusa TaxID=172846 RepID=A0AAV4Y5A1_CAEEX|nr:hypothetical protein CEXT_605621 [Caerostris extrusa]